MSRYVVKLRLLMGVILVLSGLISSGCGNSAKVTGGLITPVIAGNTEFVSSGPVMLRTRVLLWSDERLELEYQLHNNITSTLKVFNEAPKAAIFTGHEPHAADILLKNKKPILFSGAVFRDDCLKPDSPSTVSAHTLPPRHVLKARLSQSLPLKSFCIDVPENGANPDSLEFCVGYQEETDENLVIALAQGEQQSGQNGQYITSIVGQMRVCVTLLR